MNVAIVGAGGVGGSIAARLVHAGVPTTIVARGETRDAIRRDGLTLEAPDGTITVRPRLVTGDPRELDVADIVLVCVKAWQVGDALDAVRAACGSETVVVPLQNGVDAIDVLSDGVGRDHVLAGTIEVLSERTGPARVVQRSRAPIIRFGEIDGARSGAGARVAAVRAALSCEGLVVETPADAMLAVWKKLLFMAPFSGVGSVVRLPVGAWREVPATRRLATTVIAEVAAVAKAHGVALEAAAEREALRTIDVLPFERKSSMQRDVEAGGRFELDAQVTTVARRGATKGIATPAHDFVLAALEPHELRARAAAAAATGAR